MEKIDIIIGSAALVCIFVLFIVGFGYSTTVNTYPGSSFLIYRENEIGMYTLDTALCVIKIIQRDNGTTDIITCDKDVFRLQPKQFFKKQ